jgi:hypothetical protein
MGQRLHADTSCLLTSGLGPLARFSNAFSDFISTPFDEQTGPDLPTGAELAERCFSPGWTSLELDVFLNYLRLAEVRTGPEIRRSGLERLVERLSQEMRLDPSRPRIRLLYAQVLLTSGRHDEGLAHLRKIMMSRFAEREDAKQVLDAVFEGRFECL